MGLRKLFGSKPDPAAKIIAAITSWIDEVWPEGPKYGAEQEEELAESLRRLRLTMTSEQLRDGAAALVFDTESWVTRYNAHHPTKLVIVKVSIAAIVADPPVDLVERVRRRVEHLRANGDRTLSVPHHIPEYGHLALRVLDLPPGIEQLLYIIEQAAPDDHDAVALVTDLALNGYGGDRLNTRLISRYVLFLHRTGSLDYPLFKRIAVANPRTAKLLAPNKVQRLMQTDAWPRELSSRLFTELVSQAELSEVDAGLLATCEPHPGHLEDAIRFHAAHDLGSFDTDRAFMKSRAHAACRVLASSGPDDGNDLIERLAGYPATSLEAFLPIAPASARVLTEALGWTDGLALIEALHRYAEVEASASSDVGAIDVQALRLAIDEAGPQQSKRIFEIFKQAKFKKNLIKLIQAAMGEHGEWIRDALPKRNQLAVRAMAAAPIENGFDEVQARYRWLQTFRSEAAQFGSQRQGSERGAADAAFHNLASNAGYVDTTRLRLAVAAADASPIPVWEIDDYTVRIHLIGARAATVFQRGDKIVKTPPKAVKDSGHYDEIKLARKSIQDEARDFARMYEWAMTIGDRFSADELESLLKVPIGASVLEGLIVEDETGATARLVHSIFHDADGEPIEMRGAVAIAHPIHLAEARVLEAWQNRLVADRVVQPFKQAFRAYYRLTPVELEHGHESGRFANMVIDTGKAAALFGTREWVLPREEGGAVTRSFPTLGITAIWDLVDVGHHLTELVSAGTSGISFVSAAHHYGADKLPLAEVPATVFSEVMRDADLVVSVAPGDPEGVARYRGAMSHHADSSETIEARRQLVTALMRNLDIEGVEVDGNQARVKGRLASYRVHLGSGAIHIEPANHLCIVPSGWGTRKDIFLPFIDDGDRLISEVVSKILLLTMDHKIKDESILAQIRSATQPG